MSTYTELSLKAIDKLTEEEGRGTLELDVMRGIGLALLTLAEAAKNIAEAAEHVAKATERVASSNQSIADATKAVSHSIGIR